MKARVVHAHLPSSTTTQDSPPPNAYKPTDAAHMTIRPVHERDFRHPDFLEAKVEDYEFRADGVLVRKDRWERAVRSIAALVGVDAQSFEIAAVLAAVEKLIERPSPEEPSKTGMSRLQLLLTKLTEECCEVGQIALKTQQFGLHEVCPGQSLTNAQRTHLELDDIQAQIEMLNIEFNLGYTPNRKRIEAKKLKVDKYADYSKSLGLVR